MNILLLGNPFFKADFERAGHRVLSVNPGGYSDVAIRRYPAAVTEVLTRLPPGWNPDLIMVGDASTYPLFLDLERVDVPLVWYAIDSHIHIGWHRGYAAAFDIILVAQKDYVAAYRFDGERQLVEWCPLYCEPAIDRKVELPKIHDLCFVGTLNREWNPERVRFIEDVRRKFPLFVTSGDYVIPFCQSRVVLNQCAQADVNFRTFQALACGSLLLMERVANGLTDLFEDGVHLVLYDRGQVDQVVELTRYYCAHDAEREAIAEAGRRRVLGGHTAAHRVDAILALVRQGQAGRLVERRLARLPEIRFVLAAVHEEAANAHGRKALTLPTGSRQRSDLERMQHRYAEAGSEHRAGLEQVFGGGVR